MVDPESRTDHRMVYAAVGKQLVYHSPPLDNDLEICGFFKLRLWIAIDQPDTDFRATIYEIGADGSSLLLSSDSVRARYREGLREARLVSTGAPLCYDFDHFTFVARRMSKGSRLRLVLGPIQSIYFARNYNSGTCVAGQSMADARRVTVQLYHDPAHPSALHVPLGRAQ
jgi:predicted acyl esterase